MLKCFFFCGYFSCRVDISFPWAILSAHQNRPARTGLLLTLLLPNGFCHESYCVLLLNWSRRQPVCLSPGSGQSLKGASLDRDRFAKPLNCKKNLIPVPTMNTIVTTLTKLPNYKIEKNYQNHNFPTFSIAKSPNCMQKSLSCFSHESHCFSDHTVLPAQCDLPHPVRGGRADSQGVRGRRVRQAGLLSTLCSRR